ncbi:hypothetical protein NC653_000265 [Populus alba x Populus x berolinensis]|uniref:U-box domain-containing protein n=1 Tax=Populus alba x Populus x berolinensis TaxID=444605 RepID=A0AAD6WE58_9ROSI|nr:hypothetical protein NC653_000265 [Populus alba x Populus x berolinensis]
MDILMKDPHDFICPLTGQLFEDPVTLETGQTFEREAIGERFDHGNRTCPVTGKTLACSTVPLANSILNGHKLKEEAEKDLHRNQEGNKVEHKYQ